MELVADLISNGIWKWPAEWKNRYDFLFDFSPPVLSSLKKDIVVWKDEDARFDCFFVKKSWNHVRNISDKVIWAKLVWYSHCIPRHSFCVWLAIKKRLKTQDKLIKWGCKTDLLCSLCNIQNDSHD